MEAFAGKLQGLRILVVEDEALVLMQIVDMLADFGCKTVGPASTVPSALTAIGNNELDGVLLDLNLQGERSLPVAEKLLALGVPFLLVTGYANRSGESSILTDAPRLTKPFTQEGLSIAMVAAFTSQEQATGR